MFTPPLPVLYPLRTVQTAEVRSTEGSRGRLHVAIHHRPLAGVTPSMLLDWFTHLDGTMMYGGRVVERYHAWHPTDHVRWELWRSAPGGGVAEGARLHMVEAFDARPDLVVATVARVEKLDETGLRLAARMAGVPAFRLEHRWRAGEDGALCVTTLELGVRTSLGRMVNPVLRRRFSAAKVNAWVRHTVEEIGQLEHLLPQLR